MILGVFPEAEYIKEKIDIHNHSLLFVYTDGLTETKNSEDQEFGIIGLETILSKCRKHLSADDVVDHVFKNINEFSEGRPAEDDRTAMVLVFE